MKLNEAVKTILKFLQEKKWIVKPDTLIKFSDDLQNPETTSLTLEFKKINSTSPPQSSSSSPPQDSPFPNGSKYGARSNILEELKKKQEEKKRKEQEEKEEKRKEEEEKEERKKTKIKPIEKDEKEKDEKEIILDHLLDPDDPYFENFDYLNYLSKDELKAKLLEFQNTFQIVFKINYHKTPNSLSIHNKPFKLLVECLIEFLKTKKPKPAPTKKRKNIIDDIEEQQIKKKLKE